jgi:hypothetical protein
LVFSTNQWVNILVNPANIISEFRSCGILPFNPLAVPSEAFNPSVNFENQHTESSNHPMSWVTDKLNDLSTKMNYTLHDELTENGTDISEIVTENEATPDSLPHLLFRLFHGSGGHLK